jgi:hypothetical protein
MERRIFQVYDADTHEKLAEQKFTLEQWIALCEKHKGKVFEVIVKQEGNGK